MFYEGGGYSLFDGESQRHPPLPDALKEVLSHEVRLTRLRLSTRASAAKAAGAGAGGTGAGEEAAAPRAPVLLPEHVARQLAAVAGQASVGPSAAAAAAAAAAEAAAAAALPRNFLSEAASKSRELHMARKRLAVTVEDGGSGADGAPAAGAGAGAANGGGGGGGGKAKYPVFFRFQEGFTNAVKRTLRISDFL